MKKLICIAALLISASANAAYVSVLEYKGLNCDELKEEYLKQVDEVAKEFL